MPSPIALLTSVRSRVCSGSNIYGLRLSSSLVPVKVCLSRPSTAVPPSSPAEKKGLGGFLACIFSGCIRGTGGGKTDQPAHGTAEVVVRITGREEGKRKEGLDEETSGKPMTVIKIRAAFLPSGNTEVLHLR